MKIWCLVYGRWISSLRNCWIWLGNSEISSCEIDLSTEASIPCQVPINRYMIERSRVLELLAEHVIEDGFDALPHNHPEAAALADDDVPMAEDQSTPASTLAAPTPAPASTPASSSTAAPTAPTTGHLSYAFLSSVNEFQHCTFERLKEIERVLKNLDNSSRFTSTHSHSANSELERLERDQITVVDQLRETRWEMTETRAMLDTLLARLPPPPPPHP